jgi:hypothetical protein
VKGLWKIEKVSGGVERELWCWKGAKRCKGGKGSCLRSKRIVLRVRWMKNG